MLELTKPFITLSLADVAKLIGINDTLKTEKLLIKMIAMGEIEAKINQITGVVRFGKDADAVLQTLPIRHDNSRLLSMDTSINSNSAINNNTNKEQEQEFILHQLEDQIKASIYISEKLRNLQQKVLTSKEHLGRSGGGMGSIGRCVFIFSCTLFMMVI